MPKNRFWGQNFKNLKLDLESASLRYYAYQFSDKVDNFEFLGPNLPKNGFWCQNFKSLSLDSESASLRYYAHQFSDKTKNFEFFPKFAQKWILGLKFQKSKSGFEISILEILRAPIFRQNGQLWSFGPNLPKNGFWGRNFKNLSLD